MKRLFGIDLLKAVAMVMVVSLHIMGRGGVLNTCAQHSHSLQYGICSLFHTACMCSVNCFVLATGFIMSRHTFKYARIFALWGEVVFYSLAIALVAVVFFPSVPIGWQDWLKAVMPIAFNRYWFISCYVGLFFTIPFLNQLLMSLERQEQRRLLLTGFGLLSLLPCLSGNDMFAHHFGYSLIWFYFLYLWAGYIALNEVWRRVSVGRCCLAFLLAMGASVGLGIFYGRLERTVGLVGNGWGQYASPLILIEATSLLILAAKIEIKSLVLKRLIAYLAPSIVSVYVIHSNGVFRQMVAWNGRFAFLADYGVFGLVGSVLGFAVAIFIGCVLVDVARRESWALIVRTLHGVLPHR